jgi:hypothetical protein
MDNEERLERAIFAFEVAGFLAKRIENEDQIRITKDEQSSIFTTEALIEIAIKNKWI